MKADEAAERMGVSRQAITRWIRSGRLPARRIDIDDGGRRTHFYEIALGDLMDFDRDWPTPNRCNIARDPSRRSRRRALKRTMPTALNRL